MGYGEFVFSEQKGGLACCWSIKNPEVIKPTNMILKYRYSYFFFLKRNPISNHGLWWVISPLSDFGPQCPIFDFGHLWPIFDCRFWKVWPIFYFGHQWPIFYFGP